MRRLRGVTRTADQPGALRGHARREARRRAALRRGVLINESTFEEMMNAHTERAFTWRQLVRALHERDCLPAWRTREVNRFAECGEGNGRETWRP